jgi:hypothetical protein
MQQDVVDTLRHHPAYLTYSLLFRVGPRTAYFHAHGHRLRPAAQYLAWSDAEFCNQLCVPQEDYMLFRNRWLSGEEAIWLCRPDSF